MKKSRIWLGIIVILVLTFLVSADVEYPDISCELCPSFFGEEGYCHPTTQICILKEEGTNLDLTPTLSTTSSTTTLPSDTEASLLPETLANFQTQLLSSQNRLTSLEQNYNSLFTQINQLNSQIAQVSGSLQNLQQGQIKNVQEELNTVSTGLAAIQKDLASTEAELVVLEKDLAKERLATKIFSYTFLILLTLGVALAVIYYLNRTKKQLDPEIINYITTHIKKGQKYPLIKTNLLDAGWKEDEIKWAYKETMKHNYASYQQKNKPHLGYDKNKIYLLAGISIIVVAFVFFLFLRGSSVGKATEFRDQETFRIAVKANLDSFLDKSQFYPLIDQGEFCVEVIDGPKSVSFKITKTPSSHLIEEAHPCTADLGYTASLLFSSWQSFNVLSRKPTCENFLNQHKKGVVVLPSFYVLPGFHKNPTKNYTSFCEALAVCLNTVKLNNIGC